MDPETLEREIEHAGLALSHPDGELKGVYLVNGTRLAAFARIAEVVRQRYVTVLTHWWEVDRARVREYRGYASMFDAVASPSSEWDRVFDFAPIVRSNSSDLWVDDTMWPDLGIERDIDVVESVSVPWVHKRPLVWLREVQRLPGRPGRRTCCVHDETRADGERGPDAATETTSSSASSSAMTRASSSRCAPRRRRFSGPTTVRSSSITRPAAISGHAASPRPCTAGAWSCSVRSRGSSTATAHPMIWRRIAVQDGLRPLPAYEHADVRQWRSTQVAREELLDALERQQNVNRAIEPFTMFSSKRAHGLGRTRRLRANSRCDRDH